MRRGLATRTAALLAVGALPLLALGCGDSEDALTAERPASPIELTARIDDKSVTVDPNEFGGGLVNITISNQSDDSVQLIIEDADSRLEGTPIPAHGVGSLKADLETGAYTVTAGDDATQKPGELIVGEPRESAQNQLLLP